MFNNNKKLLLQTSVPLQVPRITTKTMADKLAADFDANINTLEEYITLLREKVEVKERVDDEILRKNFLKIDEAARAKIWQLLFSKETPPTISEQDEIGAFLKEVKTNAGFHSPWEYNEWIVKVRDELLKRNMLDFWRNEVVKFELGPCTWRDSDYLDRSDGDDIASFYHYAGCTAPFERTAADGAEDFDGQLNNIEDYSKMMALYMELDEIDDEEVTQENYRKISASTRKLVWKLLFEKTPASAEDMKQAADLLEKHRPDAAFYGPWDYNDWIVKLRDELLKRNMIEFWRDVIVQKELGLIWAKDSDFYDDMTDKNPARFYEQAGCKAPFS